MAINNMPVPILGEQVGIVKPLVTPDEAVQAFNAYQQLKQKLRGEGDFVQFKDRNGNLKEAPTKQWRSKLSRFFGISCDIISEEIQNLPDGTFVVKVTARAVAPNGLYQYGDGSCWSKTKERFDKDGNPVGDLYHNTRSHAVTRAKNRAVLELVGFGEVSAEEIEQGEDETTSAIRQQLISPSPKPKTNGKLSDEISDSQRSFILKLAEYFYPGASEEEKIVKLAEKWDIDISKATKKDASNLIELLQKSIKADRAKGEGQTESQ